MDDEMKANFERTKEIYKAVLDADLHQSDVANRLLIPIAFLTAAATSLFTFFLKEEVSFGWEGVNLIPLLYLLYLSFTIGGIITFFEVIGPAFEMRGFFKRKERQGEGKEDTGEPASTLFFKLIAEMKESDWIDYHHSKTVGDLYKRQIDDYIFESYQLAVKAHGKIRKNLIAHMFFYPSFCSLFLMTFFGTAGYLGSGTSIVAGTAVVGILIFTVTELKVFLEYVGEGKKG